MSETFYCTPTVAMREIEEAPEGLLEEIMEQRSYRSIVPYTDKPASERPAHPLMELACEIDAALILEDPAVKRGANG